MVGLIDRGARGGAEGVMFVELAHADGIVGVCELLYLVQDAFTAEVNSKVVWHLLKQEF